MLDNGPHLSTWDVLTLGTFCPLGRFVPWDVLSLGTFCPLGRFVPGTFCPWDVLSLGRFAPGTFCPWDVLSLGRFVLGCFVLGRFVCASLFYTEPSFFAWAGAELFGQLRILLLVWKEFFKLLIQFCSSFNFPHSLCTLCSATRVWNGNQCCGAVSFWPGSS